MLNNHDNYNNGDVFYPQLTKISEQFERFLDGNIEIAIRLSMNVDHEFAGTSECMTMVISPRYFLQQKSVMMKFIKLSFFQNNQWKMHLNLVK
jgi:hypothetical protein